MYGEPKKGFVEFLRKLCEMKQIQLLKGSVCEDIVHMYVAIPPKMSVSEEMCIRDSLHTEVRSRRLPTMITISWT